MARIRIVLVISSLVVLTGCDIEGMTTESQQLGEQIKAGHNRPPANDAPTSFPYYVDEGESVSIHTADGNGYRVKLPSPIGYSGPPPGMVETNVLVDSHEIVVTTNNFVVHSVLMDGKPVERQ